MMAARKGLSKLDPRDPTDDTLDALEADAEDDAVDEGDDTRKLPLSCRFPKPVYISEDLTRNRAKIAYEARMMKRQGLISDTWVFDCSILIRDSEGLIKKISKKEDLKKCALR